MIPASQDLPGRLWLLCDLDQKYSSSVGLEDLSQHSFIKNNNDDNNNNHYNNYNNNENTYLIICE